MPVHHGDEACAYLTSILYESARRLQILVKSLEGPVLTLPLGFNDVVDGGTIRGQAAPGNNTKEPSYCSPMVDLHFYIVTYCSHPACGDFELEIFNQKTRPAAWKYCSKIQPIRNLGSGRGIHIDCTLSTSGRGGRLYRSSQVPSSTSTFRTYPRPTPSQLSSSLYEAIERSPNSP